MDKISYDLLALIPKAKDYKCPCGNVAHEYDPAKGYKVKGVLYPKYFNERKGYNGDDYHDWEEIHFCKKCKKEYWFTNGAY